MSQLREKIGLGLTPFGGAGQADVVSNERIKRIVQRAIEHYGIRQFDGATLYQSNRQIGIVLRELGVQPSEVQHYTKVGRDLVLARAGETARVTDQPEGFWNRRFPYNRAVPRWAWGEIEIRSQLYDAYENLFDVDLPIPDGTEGVIEGVPCFAGVALHDPADYRDWLRKESGDPSKEIDWQFFEKETFSALRGEKESGFIRELGIGTKETQVTTQFIERFGTDLDYVMYTGLDLLGDYTECNRMYELMKSKNISLVKAGMYGGGILKATAEQLSEEHLATEVQIYNYAEADMNLRRRHLAIWKIAQSHGLESVKPVAVGFVKQFLHDGEVDLPRIERLIIGVDTVAQLDENMSLLDDPGVPKEFWRALRSATYQDARGMTLPVVSEDLPLPE